jgi:hypothetical protein
VWRHRPAVAWCRSEAAASSVPDLGRSAVARSTRRILGAGDRSFRYSPDHSSVPLPSLVARRIQGGRAIPPRCPETTALGTITAPMALAEIELRRAEFIAWVTDKGYDPPIFWGKFPVEAEIVFGASRQTGCSAPVAMKLQSLRMRARSHPPSRNQDHHPVEAANIDGGATRRPAQTWSKARKAGNRLRQDALRHQCQVDYERATAGHAGKKPSRKGWRLTRHRPQGPK